MKQVIRIMVTIAIALCFAAPVIGAGQEMSKPNINLFAGEVQAIDVKEKTIYLKNDKAEMTIACNDKTVMRSGMSNVAAFGDIKTGDIAAAVYDVIDGRNVAKSITFQSVNSAAPAK